MFNFRCSSRKGVILNTKLAAEICKNSIFCYARVIASRTREVAAWFPLSIHFLLKTKMLTTVQPLVNPITWNHRVTRQILCRPKSIRFWPLNGAVNELSARKNGKEEKRFVSFWPADGKKSGRSAEIYWRAPCAQYQHWLATWKSGRRRNLYT